MGHPVFARLTTLLKLVLSVAVAGAIFVDCILIAMSVDRNTRADEVRTEGRSYRDPAYDGLGGGIFGFPLALYVGLALWRGMKRRELS